jgi:hypothetical protein
MPPRIVVLNLEGLPMNRVMKCLVAACLVSLGIAASAADSKEEGFVQLFDGKSFDGWKINERPESWSIVDGAFVAKGDRSHLFYVGDEKPFVNFELRADVMTRTSQQWWYLFPYQVPT